MTTPRRHIRDLLSAGIAAGRDRDDAMSLAIDAVLDHDDLVGAVVAEFVRTEYTRLTANPTGRPRKSAAALREQIEDDAAESPFRHIAISPSIPTLTRDIVIDLAGMTKVEALAFAANLEHEAAGTAKAAGFVRAVASQLTSTEKVGDRFDLPTLRSQWGRASVTLETRFYLGDREQSRKAVTG